MEKKEFSSLEDQFEYAIDLQQNWKFKEAKNQYENIIKKDPNDANAHHNLGVLFAVQLLQPKEALCHFESALSINPNKLQFWYSYLDALIKVGVLDMAEHVLALASNYGLNELQINSFERDIRLARGSVSELLELALADAEPLPEPQLQIISSPQMLDEPSESDIRKLLSIFNRKKYDVVVKNASDLIDKFPNAIVLWQLLAESEKRIGDKEDALKAYRKLADLQPKNLSAQIDLADILIAEELLEEAYGVLENVLINQPKYAPALCKIGQIYHKQGYVKKALHSYARALEQEPSNPIYLEKFGSVLRLQGDQDGALICFKSAVEGSPNSAELQDAYGITLRNQDRLAAAENAFRMALKIHPGYTPALKNLCHLLEIHGRFAEAEAGLLHFAEIDKGSAESLFEVGRNLLHQKKAKDALDWLRRAIKAKPDYVAAHVSLSAALNEMEEPEQALAEIKESIKILPNIPHLHTNLGIINLSLSRADDAIECFRQALYIDPEFSHARSSMLFALSHSSKVTPEELYREHRVFGKMLEETVSGKEYTSYSNTRIVDRVLKIGFVSADFRNHAVAKFVIPFFEELHHRKEFATYAYSNHGAVDESMLKIKENFDVWHTVVKWDDKKIAEKIREDQIDILFDMSGHTAGDKLRVFAMHPAPVQVTWVGYPGTTGLKAMDYALVERSLLFCENIKKQFKEKIISVPVGVPFDGKAHLPDCEELPFLKNGFLTFGSFNRMNKISKETIKTWAKVLRAIPTSKLQMAGIPSGNMSEELLSWFSEEGVDEDRIYFYPRMGFVEYLKLHNNVDICLDTFPYTGGTTSLHALWMGVPTLTIHGQSYSQFQGEIIIRKVGLENYFLAQDDVDFVKKAVFMSENPDLLKLIREKVRSYLLDSYDSNVTACVDGFSLGLRKAWEGWCANKKANHIDVKETDIGMSEIKLKDL